MAIISSIGSAGSYVAPYQAAGQQTSGQTVAGQAEFERVHRHAAVLRGETAPAAQDSSESAASSDSSSSGLVSYNAEASADYRSLVKDLRAGNIGLVQSDYSKLQNDLRIGQGQSTHVHSTSAVTSAATTDTTDSAGSVLDVTV